MRKTPKTNEEWQAERLQIANRHAFLALNTLKQYHEQNDIPVPKIVLDVMKYIEGEIKNEENTYVLGDIITTGVDGESGHHSNTTGD